MAEDVDPPVAETSLQSGRVNTVIRKSEQGANQPHPLRKALLGEKPSFPTQGLLGDSPDNPARLTS